jgi:hypothetical protein
MYCLLALEIRSRVRIPRLTCTYLCALFCIFFPMWIEVTRRADPASKVSHLISKSGVLLVIFWKKHLPVSSGFFCSEFGATISLEALVINCQTTRCHIPEGSNLCIHVYGKAVPLQAWNGPEGSRRLRFQDFVTTAQFGGKVVSLTHRPPLPPVNAPGTHFC